MKTVNELIEKTSHPLACSVLSVLEIRVGMRKGEEKRTNELLDSFEAISVNEAVAGRAADLIRRRSKQKNPKEWIDALIAATCLEHDLVLVTYNHKDYPYRELPIEAV